ncbi:hypothetical protein ALI22I_08205 [Saccharothrix sp. ALI-22-I]|nr:hypothetical protein ALI22I_08205 [Saccharothrix sp. ALI-22-I]
MPVPPANTLWHAKMRSYDQLDHAAFASAADDSTGLDDVLAWLEAERAEVSCELEPVPLDEIARWRTDTATGDLVHDSGRFFAIRGLDVTTNYGPVERWSQPIIDQPEVGVLGLLVREVRGVTQVLIQAKMEPGNINLVQLSPTVQATHSNYDRVHGGAAPRYLEHFLAGTRDRVRVDVLQSEQGARFLRKRNRNMIVEVIGDVPVHEGFRWLTLRQLHRLLRLDNVVNMDLRSVLSCLQFSRWSAGMPTRSDLLAGQHSPLAHSVLAPDDALHTSGELLAWSTDARMRYRLNTRIVPLSEVSRWQRDKWHIAHEDGLYFTVGGVAVRMASREVSGWMQPVIAPTHEGLAAMVLTSINGVPHALMQAKLEAGNRDVVEIAPTVQCITRNYQHLLPEERPEHLSLVTDVAPEHVLFDAYQSEEGGRFFRQQNKYVIVEYHGDLHAVESPNHRWMSIGQLKNLVLYSNYVNVEARSLLACACAVIEGGNA